ncbi:S-adenosyl-L-methionine-dependent methyltransferase [Xylariales sp. PMI_506]|nr:S-adenosyl-L-methionine-dependent methyltransferase [Xylariales sp. PMI_506]
MSNKLAAAAMSRLPLSEYSSASHILDSACGPGIVTGLLLSPSPSCVSVPGLPIAAGAPRVTAIDISPAAIAQFNTRGVAEDWGTGDGDGNGGDGAVGTGTRVRAFVRDAEDLACFADAEFDAVIMNLGIFNLGDAAHGAAEIRRVLKPGGYAAVTTWKHLGGLGPLERVVEAIRPGQRALPPTPPEWRTKEKLVAVMEAGGFTAEQMQVWDENVRWEASGLDDIVESFISPPWAAELIWKGWTPEEMGRIGAEVVKQLSDEQRETASITNVGWVCVAKKRS